MAYGVRIGIRANKPEFLDRFLGMIPDIWKPSSERLVDRLYSLQVGDDEASGNGISSYHLYEDRNRVASSTDMGFILDSCESQLKMYLAEMARRRVFVHAGAVGWRGEAIIIPGRSFSGKTSLVAELVRAGATYYSDEYAVLDNRGRVHPYASPLALRDPVSFKQTRCSIEEFGGEKGIKPLPVGLVIVTRYEPGRLWRPRKLSAGKAMLELLAHTIPVRRKPEAAINTLQKVLAEAVTFKSVRGEAGGIVDFIFDSLNNADGSPARVGRMPCFTRR